MRVAFDIDDTLWKIYFKGNFRNPHQAPDYDMIQVLRWFYNNGDFVYVWSAGGVYYAEDIVYKLGLEDMVTVIKKEAVPSVPIDICFDDQEVKLAKVNIRVNRPRPEKDEEVDT